MCGDIVLEASTGKVHYTAKAHFDSCPPLDSTVYYVTVPIDHVSPFQPLPLPKYDNASDLVDSLTGAPTTTCRTGESVLSDLKPTNVPESTTSLSQTGESSLPDFAPPVKDALTT